MKKNHRLNTILIIGLTLGFGFTIAVVSAAPPIAVTSAVPDEAEQGTTSLTVIINGRGFDPVMDVKFCRSETNETCVDGGVDVKPGSVRFISSKKLEVTVDVGLEANIGNFDIEAISLSSGRRGRGIEKFAVLTPSITYTAELRGALVFAPLSVVLEGQDERLKNGDPVTIVRPTTGVELTAWNLVFNVCGLLDPVPEFTAPAGKKGWRISRPGGVYVLFRKVGPLSSTIGDLEVSLQLVGDCAYSGGTAACDPFPPVPDDDYGHGFGISEIPLTHFNIHASGEKGITHSIEGCHSESADLLVDSTLVITATAPAP